MTASKTTAEVFGNYRLRHDRGTRALSWPLILLVSVICSFCFASTAEADTFRDEFDANVYTGNNGTVNWTGDWIEVNEGNGPTLGFLRVTTSGSCTAGNCMRIGQNGGDNQSKWLQREADTSAATVAILTYDVVTSSTNRGWVDVDVRVGGSGAWTRLAEYDMNSQSYNQCDGHDISAFIGTDTEIRFHGTNRDHDPTVNEQFRGFFHFDNIQIWADESSPYCTTLSLTKTDSADPVPVSTSFTYTLVVTNTGASSVTSVELVDTLPAGVTYQSYTSTQGSCSESSGVVTCPLGTIASSGDATVTITVLSPATSGSITNGAVVTANGSTPALITEDTLITAPVCPSGGTVSTTVDATTGDSLRACIIWANGNPGVNTLTVLAGTYTLTIAGTGENAAATGDLDITDGIIINGNAAGATIIDANSIDRVFEVLGASATFTNLTVTGGNVTGDGGGISIDPTGSLTLSNSTVNGNTSTADGGAIMSTGTTALTNVTLSGNTADRGGGISCIGPCTLTNVSVTNNTAPTNGGGVHQRTGSGSVTFLNTIVANNISAGDANCNGSNANLISNGNNLSSDATCDFTSAGDLENTDPLLGPLQDNGGPTFTHDLLTGSPAIEGGTNTGCPATDQRGTARPESVLCDIGAVEGVAGLEIVKRSFQTDGTPIASGSIVPSYLEFKYLLYINNNGAARTDVSVRDILDPAFQYQLESMRVDNSVAACALAVCDAAEELAIFTAVNGAAVLTDAVGDDLVSYAAATIDAGNENAGNLQLDINADSVWAILFSVKMP